MASVLATLQGLMMSLMSSSSSIFAFVTRWSNSRRVTLVTWSSTFGTQWIFFLVSLTLPAMFRRPTMSTTLPLASLLTLSTKQLPQCSSVTCSPGSISTASSCSTQIWLHWMITRSPRSSFFGCFFSFTALGCDGPSSRSSTALSWPTAAYLGTTGSIFCLLIAQILSHSMRFVAFDMPCVMTNSSRPSTVMPRRSTPCTVGNRGSFQPST
mmetsp:Transcript_3780/g.10539  ORF Transcript_3780/g.10539 Transcript_3780/m.10539 type:complete len:211 (-) Transcript_3780:1112-1744(-)